MTGSDGLPADSGPGLVYIRNNEESDLAQKQRVEV
jgi:hypothetical protein